MHNKNSRVPDLQAQVCLSGALTSYWACGSHSLVVNYTSLSSNPCQFKVILSLAFPQGCPRIHLSFSHHFIGMLHLYHVFCILVSHPSFLVLYCPFPASADKIYFILLHFLSCQLYVTLRAQRPSSTADVCTRAFCPRQSS